MDTPRGACAFRFAVACVTAAALAAASPTANAAADPHKVLRIASTDITSLDPQQGTDLLSTRVAIQIFEALYQFDYFAVPAKVIPNTAEAMPVITDAGKTWTINLQKGIHFADDPVFRGKPRELTARDYVYSIMRSLDPNLRPGGDAALTDLVVGARPIVDAARKPGAKLDYDAPIEGLRALDRYTDLSQAWMPMVLHTFGVGNVLYYPWLQGYWPSDFGGAWKYADIDLAKKNAARRSVAAHQIGAHRCLAIAAHAKYSCAAVRPAQYTQEDVCTQGVPHEAPHRYLPFGQYSTCHRFASTIRDCPTGSRGERLWLLRAGSGSPQITRVAGCPRPRVRSPFSAYVSTTGGMQCLTPRPSALCACLP